MSKVIENCGTFWFKIIIIFSFGYFDFYYLAPPSQALQLYITNNEDEHVEDSHQDAPTVPKTTVIEESTGSQFLVEKEEMEEGVVKFHVYKTYWRAIGTILPVIVLFFCLLMQGE